MLDLPSFEVGANITSAFFIRSAARTVTSSGSPGPHPIQKSFMGYAQSQSNLSLLWIELITSVAVDDLYGLSRAGGCRSMYTFIVSAGFALDPCLRIDHLVLFHHKDFWRKNFTAAKRHTERRLNNYVEPAPWHIK